MIQTRILLCTLSVATLCICTTSPNFEYILQNKHSSYSTNRIEKYLLVQANLKKFRLKNTISSIIYLYLLLKP